VEDLKIIDPAWRTVKGVLRIVMAVKRLLAIEMQLGNQK